MLRQYAQQNSEAAFAALVTRHVPLVYSAALRKTGNPSAAEEVTQAVFIIFARKARGLGRETALAGWLYQAARLTAANFLRTEIRRARREQEAIMQSLANETGPETWRQIMPLLEDAMGRLGERERNAVVLRFFEGKSFQEVGAAVGASENAAKKRVAHALEKLRRFFLKHGVNSTAAAIGETISANSVQAAPVGLAKAVSAVALAKGAAASTSTLTLIKGALKIMAWTKTKTAVITTAALLLAGVGTSLVTLKIIHAFRVAHYPNIAGIWEGVVRLEEAGVGNNQAAQTHVVLRLFKTNGVYRATADWPEWGRKDVPMGKVVYNYPDLVIQQSVRSTWSLKVNPHATQMLWDRYIHFIQPDPVVLRRTPAPTPVPEPLTESDFAPRPDSALQGYWKGMIGTGTNGVSVDLKIARQADGTFQAEGDVPMQGIQGRPVIVSYNPPRVEFRPADGAGMFRGQLNDSDTELSGSWTQGGQSMPASVRRVDYRAEHAREADKDYSFASKNDLQGHWMGRWIVPIGKTRTPIRQALDIAKLPDGSYSATIADVDGFGGEAPVPASDFEYSPPHLRVECESEGWAFDGKMKNGKIVGTWSQGGGGFPLVFERAK